MVRQSVSVALLVESLFAARYASTNWVASFAAAWGHFFHAIEALHTCWTAADNARWTAPLLSVGGRQLDFAGSPQCCLSFDRSLLTQNADSSAHKVCSNMHGRFSVSTWNGCMLKYLTSWWVYTLCLRSSRARLSVDQTIVCLASIGAQSIDERWPCQTCLLWTK